MARVNLKKEVVKLKSVYSVMKKNSVKDKEESMTAEEESQFLSKFVSGEVENITGKVIRGNGKGKTVGFPTANIEWSTKKLEQGCYLCNLTASNSTTGEEITSLEGILIMESDTEQCSVHILDFSQDIYDWDLTVTPTKEVSKEVLDKIKTISSEIREKDFVAHIN
jgi:FAD synthase